MAFWLNLLLLVLELRGLWISFSARKLKNFVFYTQLSNLLCAFSCLLYVLFGPADWVTDIRYLASCALVMTFLVTLGVLIPMGGDPKYLLLRGNGPYHHLICPVLCFVSYLFFEGHAGMSMVIPSMILTLIYGLIMLYLNYVRKVNGPYPFFRVHQQSVLASVIWVMVLLALIGGISAGMCVVSAIVS
ncbi:MAG: hypothetical protein IKF51_04280 [Solobacterium sp.]|nr:hypothetical protein [Solobacterium sp.]